MGKKKIILEYEYSDVFAIIGYQKFLTKHLKNGDKIPARVLNKFFSFFIIEQNRLKYELKKKSDIIKQQTLERYKEYYFNKKLSGTIKLFGIKTESICSFENMINSVFEDIEKKFLETYEKESLINLINSSINKYFNTFKVNADNILTKYKRNVIVGFITYKFGFHLSKEIVEFKDEEPSNQVLHQAIKYHTSKNKKKSK